jgi:hypothetical protein
MRRIKLKKEKESGSGTKAANSHVLVATPSTEWGASIEEVNDIGVALYAAERVRWMMDSGATHHITPINPTLRIIPHAKALYA